MEHSEESAAESEAQGFGIFQLIFYRAIVDGKLFQAVFELIIIVGIYRIDSCVNERLHFLESRDDQRG